MSSEHMQQTARQIDHLPPRYVTVPNTLRRGTLVVTFDIVYSDNSENYSRPVASVKGSCAFSDEFARSRHRH